MSYLVDGGLPMDIHVKRLFDAYAEDAEISDDDMEYAKNIFKVLKEDEKTRQTWCDKHEQPELFWAKYDLHRMGIKVDGLTKNQIYLKHQSELINGFYRIIKELQK